MYNYAIFGYLLSGGCGVLSILRVEETPGGLSRPWEEDMVNYGAIDLSVVVVQRWRRTKVRGVCWYPFCSSTPVVEA